MLSATGISTDLCFQMLYITSQCVESVTTTKVKFEEQQEFCSLWTSICVLFGMVPVERLHMWELYYIMNDFNVQIDYKNTSFAMSWSETVHNLSKQVM